MHAFRARFISLERETGFEPATPSLEGSCSSQLSYSRPRNSPDLGFAFEAARATGFRELNPFMDRLHGPVSVVERGGFEPPKA